ncbi:hypothetical protein H9L19_06825 [Weissella diestrammenae]|uniref:DUF806 family protein n=1 Tax=Weissella diestrammenae TaxID=1162633 RepID=A0A7G9T4Q6_9LACO|nr:hypothetical protein [Weissella diestrammenae]MCM0582792.1 hypothetical protein [Weissella diestrammenae]QNN75081.1 hypothetical protein H9L19_06825 [Weissella diestrammenae]
MKKYFTRAEVQKILSQNALHAEANYLDRESDDSPDNFIVYFRLSPNATVYADDQVHIRKALLQVSHYHKRKLDNISQLMVDNFNVEPAAFDIKDINSDYYATHYRVEIFTGGEW